MIFQHFSAISKCCFFLEKSRKYVYNYHVDVFSHTWTTTERKICCTKDGSPFEAEKTRRKRGRDMTIQECYQQLGGDFAQAEKRLSSEKLVERFITKFLDDGSFSELCVAMDLRDHSKAFRAAHTLKGVCASLSLSRLLSSASMLTDLLRTGTETIPAGADLVFEEVMQDYALTVNAIRAYLDSNHG